MIKHRLLPVLLSAAALLGGAAFAQPAPGAFEQSAALAAIREYALSYTRRLPDYTGTQVTQWVTTYTAPQTGGRRGSPGRPMRTGVVEAQIGYVDHREIEKTLTINGKPAAGADPKDLPPTSTHGEFGTLLARVFEPQTSTEFRWDRWVMRDGRRMYVFSYRVPQSKGYIIQEGKRTTVLAFKGSVYADLETKAVMRIEMQCTDFPADSSYQSLVLNLNYKLTRVAEQAFVLPSDFKLTSRRADGVNGEDSEMDAKYKNYRRFGADATIQFGPDDSGR
jgi:hypothetical protein